MHKSLPFSNQSLPFLKSFPSSYRPRLNKLLLLLGPAPGEISSASSCTPLCGAVWNPHPARSFEPGPENWLFVPLSLFLEGAASGARVGGRAGGPRARRDHLAYALRRTWRPGRTPGGRESLSAFLFNYLHLPLGADILGSGVSVTST